MSLKKKYKTNAAAANSGVWFDYEDAPNDDGTVPGFLMARNGSQNRQHAKLLRESMKKHVDDNGVYRADDVTLEEAEEAEVTMFTGSLLLGWRNFHPNDDGAVDYSEEAARKIFADPDWHDLRQDLTNKATKAANFREKEREAATKN